MDKRILIIEDDKNALLGLSEILKEESYEVDLAANGEQAYKQYSENNYDLILTDFLLPDTDGLKIAEKIKNLDASIAIVMMTAFGSVKHAVMALKSGIDNYITKPVNIDELLIIIKKSLDEKAVQKENIALKEKLNTTYQFENIIAISGKMMDVFAKVKKVSQTDTTIMIRGESGTGKELIARAIHFNSKRKTQSLIEINCASIPETLLESELFGHEKGSFTGAIKQKIGKFEEAHKGSIFLDEIAEMPINTQAKLLRVLQEQKFTRVGGNQVVEVDVRVIAATNADLESMIEQGEFRDDLYYRLNVIPINIPALRERKEDIAPLVKFFVKKLAERNKIPIKDISAEFLKFCERYYWPGNIRELENALQSAMILGDSSSLQAIDLPEYIRSEPIKDLHLISDISLEHLPFKQQLEVAEKIIIERAIKDSKGNKTHAAKQLGFTLRTLRNKLNKYMID
jgi:two-component system response regulator AtoC